MSLAARRGRERASSLCLPGPLKLATCSTPGQGFRVRADAAHCAVLASFNATVHGNADGEWLTTPDRLADEPVLCQEPCRACPSSPRVSDLFQHGAWAISDQALLQCVDDLPEPPHLTPEAIDRVYYTRAYECDLRDEKPATNARFFDDLLTAETSDLFDWLEEDAPEGGVHFSTAEHGNAVRICAEDSDESVYATPCASLSESSLLDGNFPDPLLWAIRDCKDADFLTRELVGEFDMLGMD